MPIGASAILSLNTTDYALPMTMANFVGLGITVRPVSSQQPSVRRNILGLPKRQQQWFERFHVLEFYLSLSPYQLELLELMVSEQNRFLALGTQAYCLLSDYRNTFVETPAKTRALATGSSYQSEPVEGLSVAYYPQWRLILELPEDYYRPLQNRWFVTARGFELDKEPD